MKNKKSVWPKRLLAWCEDSCTPHRSNVLVGVIGVLSVLFIMTFLHVVMPPKTKAVATINVRQLQTTFLKQATHHSLSQEQMRVLSRRFATALEQACKNYALQHHQVLLVKGAVVSGSVDATKDIERRIAWRMHHRMAPSSVVSALKAVVC